MNAGDGAGGPSYTEAPSLQGLRTNPAPPTQANATLLCRPLSPGPRSGGSRDSERQSQAVSSKFAGRDVISVHPYGPFQKPGLISSNEEPEMRAEMRSPAAPQRSFRTEGGRASPTSRESHAEPGDDDSAPSPRRFPACLAPWPPGVGAAASALPSVPRAAPATGVGEVREEEAAVAATATATATPRVSASTRQPIA